MKRLLATPIIALTLTVLLGGSVTLGAIYIGGTGRTGEINLQKGLIGHWKFDGNSKDSSPHENNGIRIEAFTTVGSDSWTVPSGVQKVDVLIVGGGGGGSENQYDDGPGGGAGGLIFEEGLSVTPGASIPISVGSGGAVSTQGGNSSAFGFTAIGGGSGGTHRGSGGAGGSGGGSGGKYGEADTTNGGTGLQPTSDLNSPPTGYGNDGGTSVYRNYAGSGGGGAGEQGEGAPDWQVGGAGGDGMYFGNIFGDEYGGDGWFAGGGGGFPGGAGGIGGGGNVATAGTSNTGGGGGGGKTTGTRAQPGGSGVVIIKYEPSLPTTDRKGESNKAYSFNGTTDYINTSLVRSDLGSSYSISVWFKYDGTSGRTYSPIIGSIDPSGGTEFFIGKNTGNTNIGVQDGNYVSNLVTGSDAFDGSWHHMVFTSSGGTGVIYLDGVYKNTAAFTGSNNVEQITIGFEDESSGYYWIGSVDDVRMYNRVLTADEALAIYESYDPAPRISDLQKGLVGHWKFDGDAKDFTPRGNNGTLAGNASVTANDRKGQANKALTLDGTGDYASVNFSGSSGSYSAFTVTAWIYHNGGVKDVILNEQAGDTLWLTVNESSLGKLDVYLGDTTSKGYHHSTGGVSTGQWVLVGLTYDDAVDTGTFYINGNASGTFATSGTVNFDTTIRIGAAEATANEFSGDIDDVRIYNRALSATEIADLYESYDPAPRVSNLQKGLVGRWIGPYGNTSAITRDLTPYENTGTVTGATLTTDRKGQDDRAYSFNGTTNYIKASYDASLKPVSAITMGAWVKLNSTGDWHSVVQYPQQDGGHISPYFDWAIYVGSAGGLHTRIDGEGSGTHGTVSWGEWTHVAITWDGSTTLVKHYINGALVGTYDGTKTSIVYDNNNPVYFGQNAGGGEKLSGLVDDVRIYNRALSPTEITELYESYQ